MSLIPQGRLEDEDINIGSGWTDTSPLDDRVILGDATPYYNSPLYGDNGMPDDLYEEVEQIRNNNNDKPLFNTKGLILDESPICVPYKDDLIELTLSPESLHTIMTMLKSYSVNISSCEGSISNIDTLFGKQTQCRDVIDEMDGYLNNYVKNRPWHPNLKKWVTSIGKEHLRKGLDTWSV